MNLKEFSKKLLFADYTIALLLILGFFVCMIQNGIYAREFCNAAIQNGMDVSYIPKLYALEEFGIILGVWIAQLGLSSGTYYLMSKSDHKIQLPMALLNTVPDEIKSQLDMTQIITTVLSITDN